MDQKHDEILEAIKAASIVNNKAIKFWKELRAS